MTAPRLRPVGFRKTLGRLVLEPNRHPWNPEGPSSAYRRRLGALLAAVAWLSFIWAFGGCAAPPKAPWSAAPFAPTVRQMIAVELSSPEDKPYCQTIEGIANIAPGSGTDFVELNFQVPAVLGDIRLVVDAPRHPKWSWAELVLVRPDQSRRKFKLDHPISERAGKDESSSFHVLLTGVRDPCPDGCTVRVSVSASFGAKPFLTKLMAEASEDLRNVEEAVREQQLPAVTVGDKTRRTARQVASLKAPCSLKAVKAFSESVEEAVKQAREVARKAYSGTEPQPFNHKEFQAAWKALSEHQQASELVRTVAKGVRWPTEADLPLLFAHVDIQVQADAHELSPEDRMKAAFWTALALSPDTLRYQSRLRSAPPLESIEGALDRRAFVLAALKGDPIPLPGLPLFIDVTMVDWSVDLRRLCVGERGSIPARNPSAAQLALSRELDVQEDLTFRLSSLTDILRERSRVERAEQILCDVRVDLSGLSADGLENLGTGGLSELSLQIAKLTAFTPAKDCALRRAVDSAVQKLLCTAFSERQLARIQTLEQYAAFLRGGDDILRYLPESGDLACFTSSEQARHSIQDLQKLMTDRYQQIIWRTNERPLELVSRVQRAFGLRSDQISRLALGPIDLDNPPKLVLSGRKRGWGHCNRSACNELEQIQSFYPPAEADIELCSNIEPKRTTVRLKEPGSVAEKFSLRCGGNERIYLERTAQAGGVLVVHSQRPFTLGRIRSKKRLTLRLGDVQEISIKLESNEDWVEITPSRPRQGFYVTTQYIPASF